MRDFMGEGDVGVAGEGSVAGAELADVRPLEPRVLLDANLEWAVGGADQVAAAIESVADLIASQRDAAEGYFAEFADQLAIVQDGLSGLVDPLAQAADQNDGLAEIADSLRAAVGAVKAAYDDAFGTFFGEDGLAALADAVNQSVDAAAKTAAQAENDAKAAAPADERVADPGYAALFSAADLGEVYSPQSFAERGVNDAVGAKTAAKHATITGDGKVLTDAQVADAFAGGFAAFVAAAIDAGEKTPLSVVLEDVRIGDAGDPFTLVEFAQAADGAVEVTVALPSVEMALDALLGADVVGAGVSDALNAAVSTAAALTFTIAPTTTIADGAMEAIGLELKDFSVDPLFEVGGIDVDMEEAGLTLGFMSATLESVSFAKLGLFAEGLGALDLGGEVARGAGGWSFTFAGDGAVPDLVLRIVEPGGADYVDVAEGSSHELFVARAGAAFDLVGAAGATFDVTLGLGSVLDAPGAPGAGAALAAFVAAADVTRFDVEVTGGIAEADARSAVEDAVAALATMSVGEIKAFLLDLGAAISATLRSPALDVAIPFTDLRLSDAFDEVAGFFTGLGSLFEVDASKLGLSFGEYGRDLQNAVTAAQGDVLSASALRNLAGLDRVIELTAFTGRADADGAPERESVFLDLTSMPTEDGDGTPLSPGAILDVLIARLSAAFAGSGLSFSNVGGAIRIDAVKVDGAYQTFTFDGATVRGTDAPAGLDAADLGFGRNVLSDVVDAEGGATSVFTFLDGIARADLGALDVGALAGVSSIRYEVAVDGVVRTIDVKASAGSWPDVAAFAADLDAALSGLGGGLGASVNASGDGIAYTLAGSEVAAATVTLLADELTKAIDLKGLIAWVNGELAAILPGAELRFTTEGELVFAFPDVTGSVTIASGGQVGFSTEDLGLEGLTDLSLSADLTGTIQAALSTGVGIDLGGFLGAVADKAGVSGHALDQKAATDRDGFITTFLDSVFLTDLALQAGVDASADAVTGEADLGLAAIRIGGEDPSKNFVRLNAQLDATLVGERDGAFGDEMTIAFLSDKIVAGAVGELIGRFDLAGGIRTDADGFGLNASGENAGANAALDVRDDVHGDPFGAPEHGAMLLASLGDVAVDVAGIGALPEDAFRGLTISIEDLLRPLDAKVNVDSPVAEGLTGLGEGDVLDVLTQVATMLKGVSTVMAEKFPFLGTSIPLLNVSLLDSVDFAEDFLRALQDLRADPQSGLGVLKGYLEGVFGPDTVTLTWDGDEQTLAFALELAFLEEFEQTLGFQIDLAQLLGDQLAGVLGEDLAGMITGLVDAKGDASFAFDPDLGFKVAFGIDLKPTLVEPTQLAGLSARLDTLATARSLIESTSGGADLRVIYDDVAAGTRRIVEVDVEGAETLGALVGRLDAALKAEVSADVSAALVDGKVVLSDARVEAVDDADALRLFGAGNAALSGDPATLAVAPAAELSAAARFTIGVGGGTYLVSLGADPARTDAASFAVALNVAFEGIDIARGDVSAEAVRGTSVKLSQLLRADAEDGLALTATNWAAANGYDAPDLTVGGVPSDVEVAFTLQELGGSNAARLMGLATDTAQKAGDSGKAVMLAAEGGAPRVYLDTEATEFRADLTAGAREGLNVSLGFGPLSVMVQDGSAYLTDGTAGGGPAFVSLGLNDIDGTADGEYDLAHLFDLGSDPSAGFLDLFDIDMGVGIVVNLPMSDTFGFLDPEQHGLHYEGLLLAPAEGAALADAGTAALGDLFDGDLVELFQTGQIDTGASNPFTEFSFDLPDLGDFFDNFNAAAFLNDPKALLDGLTSVMDAIDGIVSDYMADVSLPVVGDALQQGITFFDDFRYDVIEPARAFAETPKADGTLPTTVDLVTGFLNDAMNGLLGTEGQEYLLAHLDTTDAANPYFYGALNFTGEVFDEMLDIDFDFGMPGFDMEVVDGSEIRLALEYLVNIGFGIDRQGFFLLNDTDQDEIGIRFLADAGTFEGSMSVLNLLHVQATAVDVDDAGNLLGTADNGTGVARVTANLGADLYGETGTLIADTGYDLSKIDPKFGAGSLQYEKLLYFGQLSFSSLIDFAFDAEASFELALVGSVIDPFTGDPLTQTKQVYNHQTGAYETVTTGFMPNVEAELVFDATFDLAAGLEIQRMGFQDVRLNVEALYTGIIASVIDPIYDFVKPLQTYFGWLTEDPFSFILDRVGTVFPILGIANTVLNVVDGILDFMEEMRARDYRIVFGDYDLIGQADDMKSGEAKLTGLTTSLKPKNPQDLARLVTEFGGQSQGFFVKLPLLEDPASAINILLGNFEEVDLVEVGYNLFNLQLDVDLVGEVTNAIGAPGWVSRIIGNAVTADFGLKFKAGFTAGYDMGGIVNFIDTFDPVRLLDGVYIDADPGALVDAYIRANVGINAGLAGLNGSVGAAVSLSFNDINGDGKLRIPELITLVEAGHEETSDPIEFLGYLFKGEASAWARLSVWAGINLPWPLPDLKFSTSVFNVDESITFGGTLPEPTIAPDVDPGQAAVLGVGAMAGASNSSLDEDGDDVVKITGNRIDFTTNKGSASDDLAAGAGGAVMALGGGTNRVELHDMAANKVTLTLAGDGNDVFELPSTGVHVVIAGDGADRIVAKAGSTGTYVVFAGGGSDTVEILGGSAVVFGADDYGLADVLKAKFASGKEAMTKAALLKTIGITESGRVDPAGEASYDTGDGRVSLATLLATYTSASQLKAGADADRITLGAGNHVVLGGRGADVITLGTGTGQHAVVKAGAGDDAVRLAGHSGTAHVEGGAGSDRIEVSGSGATEIWGWGGEADAEGQDDDAGIRSLAQNDGADLVIGGAGEDTVHGQYGGDVVIGNGGDDTITGGLDNDLLVGGAITVATAAGGAIDLLIADLHTDLTTGIVVTTVDGADGTDTIRGGAGQDVLLGGGGGDDLDGGALADLLAGDFGRVSLSSNFVAEGFESVLEDSTAAGTDIIEGGAGNDVIVAGGSGAGGAETITDLVGSNTVLGDFGDVGGARILEAVTKILSKASAAGGADTIRVGDGNDMVVGGEGADDITLGLGADIAIGDNGMIDIPASTIETLSSATSGADTIRGGNSHDPSITRGDTYDIVLGGGGDDRIHLHDAGAAVLGDDGGLTLDPTGLAALRAYEPPAEGAPQGEIDAAERALGLIAKAVRAMASDALIAGGNDVLAATGGPQTVILGGGDDAATLGDGEAYVLGDDGTFMRIEAEGADRLRFELTGTASDAAGADVITTGTADDIVLGGGGADVLTLGDGADVALGDDGLAVVVRQEGADDVTLTGGVAAGDGDDIIAAGDGGDALIGGGGGDRLDLGAGENAALGDGGALTWNGGDADRVLVLDGATGPGGADDVTGGDGSDAVVLGGAADVADLGGGDDLAIGDDGRIERRDAGLTVDIAAGSASTDGDDALDLGSGDDLAILGGGSDVAALGDGRNVVVADGGTAIWRDGGARVTLSSEAAVADGDDMITAGTGADLAILGAGSDGASLGAGDNLALGDDGNLTLDIATGTRTLESETASTDGADAVETGGGHDLVVLGGGSDEALVGAGDNAVLGDGGTLVRVDATGTDLESTTTGFDGDDMVGAGNGDDLAILGGGDDGAALGNGANAVLGDGGTLVREAGIGTDLASEATEFDGDDAVTAGSGDDLATLGGGDDDAALGDGDNAVLGDGGTLVRKDGAGTDLASATTRFDGDDEVAVGAGADLAILGGGDDTAALGNGANAVLGDGGVLGRADGAGTDLVSETTEFDGNDTVEAGSGDDLAILGGFSDAADLGAGANAVLGDGGMLRVDGAGTNLDSTATARDGNDAVTAGGGDDLAILGGGSDTADLGDGANAALGDGGRLMHERGVRTNLRSDTTGFDGDDAVTAGDGDDVVILGGGADEAVMGAGDNATLGDGGMIERRGDAAVDLQALTTEFDGDDGLVARDGRDLALLGGGSDSALLGDGDNAVLGDGGTIEWRAAAGTSLGSVTTEFDGDDTVATGRDDDLVILGGRADTADLGDGDNAALGDGGTLGRVDGVGTDLESVTTGIDGDDLIDGGSGDDLVILGGRSDVADLGDGDNAALGDGGTLGRVDGVGTDLGSVTTEFDGDDTVAAGRDDDLVILGGRSDAADLGDGDNAALGDGGTLGRVDGVGTDLESVTTGIDGDDLIDGGSGDDLVILGGRSDVADLGDGDNAALGDGGTLQRLEGARSSLSSLTTELDGDDRVDVGAGDDLVILGGRSDTAALGAGANAILGDGGALVRTYGSGTGLASAATGLDGDDVVDAGSGDDLAILGGGSDDAALGDGDNVALGDGGSLERVDGLGTDLQSTTTAFDGNDAVAVGSGDDLAILGGGADVALLGDGDNAILGDGGTVARTAGTGTNLGSRTTGFDGDDLVHAGPGDDLAILGGRSDIADLGDGANAVLGDGGEVERRGADRTDLTSSGTVLDGRDEVTTGAGRDLVVLGGGDDKAQTGGGNDAVLGDGGSLGLENGGRSLTAVTGAAETDGADDVATAQGDDVVLGGGRGDTIALGEGNNVVLGDSGSATSPDGGLTQTLTSRHAWTDGHDVVTAGAGRDLGLLGGGADEARLGDGDNAAAGDSGVLNHRSATGIRTTELVTTDIAAGGADRIEGGAGRDAFVGGDAGDLLILGDGDNAAVGDNGTLTEVLEPGRHAVLITSRATTGDASDALHAGDGDDLAVLGGGDEIATLGDGTNVVVGDSGVLDSVLAGVARVTDARTTDAGTGGDDAITGGAGVDISLGGTGGDVISSGAGDDAVLGDDGTVRHRMDDRAETTGLLEMVATDAVHGGGDAIETGVGDDRVVAGSKGDAVDLGAGDDAALADGGRLTQDRTAAGVETTLRSAADPFDGDDALLAGDGDDLAVLGGGSDSAAMGRGDDVVAGDSGEVAHAVETGTGLASVRLASLDPFAGGGDRIDGAAGDDLILGGMAGDALSGGAGDDTVLGDNGEILVNVRGGVLELLTARTVATEAGGDDTIDTHAGDDVVIAGIGDDRVSTAEGDDVALGDNGRYRAAIGGLAGLFDGGSFADAGDDVIRAGTGDDIVVAGRGDDEVHVGEGDDTGAGDNAEGTMLGRTGLQTLTLKDNGGGGNDLITAAGTARGDNLLIGQGGDDEVIGGLRDDLMAGDVMLVDLQSVTEAREGQSHVDRVLRIEANLKEIGGNDRLIGDAGEDILMGGAGGDLLLGGAGQDVLLGDMVVLERSFDFPAPVPDGGGSFETLTIDTLHAFEELGFDVIAADVIGAPASGAGADVVVGSLGPDLFYADTEYQVIFSDGFAGVFEALYPPDGFAGPSPQRELITVNFAGTGSTDVVSVAQVDEAISNTVDPDRFLVSRLDRVASEADAEGVRADALRALIDGQVGDLALDRAALDWLGTEEVMTSVAVLLTGGADMDLVLDVTLDGLVERLLAAGHDLDAAQILELERLIERVLQRTAENIGRGVAAEAPTTETRPAARPYAIAAE